MLFAPGNGNIRRRVAAIGVTLIVTPALALVAAAWAVMQRISYSAELSGGATANSNVTELKQGLVEVCQRFHEDTFDKLAGGAAILSAMGAIALDDKRALNWRAVNEATGETAELRLPVMKAGGVDFAPVADFTEPSPVVDEITVATGTPATVFQRMNERGDMLRICSSLKSANGKRQIGSFIPAGEKALRNVLLGKPYVNYLSSYRPLMDGGGQVVGMLYTALGESQVTREVRELAAQNKKIDNGELFAFRATGQGRGTALMMGDKSLEGRDLWNEKDSSGQPYVQAICLRALRLSAGEVAEYKYLKTVRVGGVPRVMVAHFTYDPALQWVVGFAQTEPDSQAAVWGIWLLLGVGAATCGLAIQVWLSCADGLAEELAAHLANLNRDAERIGAAAQALLQPDQGRQDEEPETPIEEQALNLMRLAEGINQSVAEIGADLGVKSGSESGVNQ